MPRLEDHDCQFRSTGNRFSHLRYSWKIIFLFRKEKSSESLGFDFSSFKKGKIMRYSFRDESFSLTFERQCIRVGVVGRKTESLYSRNSPRRMVPFLRKTAAEFLDIHSSRKLSPPKPWESKGRGGREREQIRGIIHACIGAH